MYSDLYGCDVKSRNSKGQFDNVVTFKIMIFNCSVKMIRRKSIKYVVNLFYNYCEF